MRHAEFQEPNWQYRIHDQDGRRYEGFAYAESESNLRQYLEAHHFIIDDVTPYNFEDWKDRAAKATARIIEAHRQGLELQFNSDLWASLKSHLFAIFHEKCAYCEARVAQLNARDVEHYRPKRRVDEDASHPGYYWLAYEVENFLPCCTDCNRARGKTNHFPVSGHRASDPQTSVAAEMPLILNPYNDDPEKHLAFAPGLVANGEFTATGTVEGLTDAGKATIEICNLRRPLLIEDRKDEEERFVNEIVQALGRLKVDKLVTLWSDVFSGARPFSAALMAQLPCLEPLGIHVPPAVYNSIQMSPSGNPSPQSSAALASSGGGTGATIAH